MLTRIYILSYNSIYMESFAEKNKAITFEFWGQNIKHIFEMWVMECSKKNSIKMLGHILLLELVYKLEVFDTLVRQIAVLFRSNLRS